MVQWLKIRLPTQGTRLQALVREDSTRRGAISPRTTTAEAHVPRASAQQQREATAMRSSRTTTKSSPRSTQLEKSPHAAMKTQRSQK